MKKLIASALCACMMTSLLIGCSGSDATTTTEPADTETTETADVKGDLPDV